MNNENYYDDDGFSSTPNRPDPFAYEEDVSEEEKSFLMASHRRPRREEIEREMKLSKRIRPLNATGSIYIDKANIPDGVDYAWVQAYSQGEGETQVNIESFMKGGWSAVKSVQHPEIRMLSSEEASELDEVMSEISTEYKINRPVLSRSARYVRHGGLLLMQKNKQANTMAISRINKQAQQRENNFHPEVFNKNQQPFDMKLSVHRG